MLNFFEYSGKTTVMPVSSNQLQYWFVEKMHPGTPAYNIPSIMNIEGNLNIPVLEESINKTINKHEIFRTVFLEKDGLPAQHIYEKLFVKLETEQSVTESEMDAALAVEINKPFSLEKGPLLRTKLFILKKDKFILVITMHHIITDLATKNIFAEDVSNYYHLLISNFEDSNLLPDYQYSYFAETQKEFIASEAADKVLSAWKIMQNGIKPFLDFPTDKYAPQILTLNGNESFFEIPDELTEKIKSFCKAETVDLFVVLLSAYSVLLSRYSGQTDFNIGVPFTNRRKEEYKNIAGCCMNILPIACDLSNDITFKEMMGRIRKNMLLAHRNQELPLDRIVSLLGSGNISYNPLFQYGFTFEPPMLINFKGLSVKPVIVEQLGARLNIFCTLWTDGNSLKGKFSYNNDIFVKESIERLIFIVLNFYFFCNRRFRTQNK